MVSPRLRSRIRALQKEVADVKVQSIDNHRASTLEALLADANKWKDRYQADFLEAQRNGLKAQATLDQIRSGRGVDK
jgi:protein HOOK3